MQEVYTDGTVSQVSELQQGREVVQIMESLANPNVDHVRIMRLRSSKLAKKRKLRKDQRKRKELRVNKKKARRNNR